MSGTLGAIGGAAARSFIEGSDFGDNLVAALPDIIGQTVGNMIVARLPVPSTGDQGTWVEEGKNPATSQDQGAIGGYYKKKNRTIDFKRYLTTPEGEEYVGNVGGNADDINVVDEVVIESAGPDHGYLASQALHDFNLVEAARQGWLRLTHGDHRRKDAEHPGIGEKDGTHYFGVHGYRPSDERVAEGRKAQKKFDHYVDTVDAPETRKQLAIGGVAIIATGLSGGALGAFALGGGISAAGITVSSGGVGAATALTTSEAALLLTGSAGVAAVLTVGSQLQRTDMADPTPPLPGFEPSRAGPTIFTTPADEQGVSGPIGGGYGSDGVPEISPIFTPIPDESLTGPQILTQDGQPGAAEGARQPFVYGDYVVDNHGNMPTPRPGRESHHGALSAWMATHYEGYNPDLAPAVLMPKAEHDATRGAYNTWRAEQRKAMGGSFEWKRVSETDMRSLSNRMFDAAKTPQPIRA